MPKVKILKYILLALISAFVMAQLEIQIEGANGWASTLPTWKYYPPQTFLGVFNSSKPITGYHIYFWLFSFLLPHFAFLTSEWTFKKEVFLISFYAFFTTFEGLFWFVLNPAFGFSTFRNGSISWYSETWVLGLPIEYWFRFAVATLLLYFSVKDSKE